MSPPGAAVGAVLALVATLSAGPGSAAESRGRYEIDAFHVLLIVKPDASLLVQETITFAFHGSHQGIFRTIPVTYPRPGIDHRLRIGEIQVLDEQRTTLRSEVSHPSGMLRIKAWVPDARDASRTVVILYRVQDGLLHFDDHDELYWNATGNEWGAPIREAEALVELPASVPPDEVRTVAYTGPRGAVGREYEADRVGSMLRYRTTRPLRLREGLTIVAGWPPGHVTFPSGWRQAWWFVTDHRWLGLPFAVLGACLLVWARTGRDPLHRSIKPEYEPPAGLRPGEMGALVDERVHGRDIVATVVDLAVRGYAHIARSPEGHDYTITLGRRWLGEPDVKPFEVLLLAQIFGDASMARGRRLSELRRDAGAVVRPIRAQLYRDLVEARCFFASPETVRTVWRFLGFLVVAVAFTLFQVDLASFQLLLAGAASGGIVAAFAGAMPRKTFRGAMLATQVRGFQEFLSRAEKDRLNRLPPDTLHRWLPHAIALGVEEAWITGFEGLTVSEPTWYASGLPFTLETYALELGRFQREAEAAWLSAPRGSGGLGGGGGGSGFSGGASSGGGFGGGGGGTF